MAAVGAERKATRPAGPTHACQCKLVLNGWRPAAAICAAMQRYGRYASWLRSLGVYAEAVTWLESSSHGEGADTPQRGTWVLTQYDSVPEGDQ